MTDGMRNTGANPLHAQAGLQICGLGVHYREKTVMSDLSFPSLAPGRVVALVGPNAAGKSSLLRAVCGLVPAKGQVLWKGQDLLKLTLQDRSALAAYMPQQLPADTHLSVLESILLALPDSRSAAALEQALETLEKLRVSRLAMQPVRNLSGGQRQLVSLAQTVMRGSPLLLLDEPVSALDLAHQWQVMQTIQSLAHQGHLVVVVLHDLTLAAQWADDVAVLKDGKLLAFGSPSEAITPHVLAQAYGVDAHVGHSANGRLYVTVDGLSAGSAQSTCTTR